MLHLYQNFNILSYLRFPHYNDVLFVFTSSCLRIVLCFCFVLFVFVLCLVYPMLPVSALSLFFNVYLHILLWLTKYMIISKIIYIIIAAVITSSVDHSWSCSEYSSLRVISYELPTKPSSQCYHLLYLY